MKKELCQSNSLTETSKIAQKILTKIKNIRLITLTGEVGSGKTYFVQQLGQYLGIKQKITSPSFVLLKLYQLPRPKNKTKYLCHIDLYRTRKGQSFINFSEYLHNPEILTIIEWPQKLKKLPRPRLEINFKIINRTSRELTIVWKD